MNNPFIYVRGLKHSDHTVFAVDKGQKNYWDNQFQRMVAYSSGQQIKRQIIEEVMRALNVSPAPVTFYFEAPKLSEKEVTTPADPRYVDQLLGGWMVALSGGGGKTIKRRSPLSISAMRPLHPLLSGINEENVSFDRSDRPDVHKVVVKDSSGKVLSENEINELLSGSDRSLRRKWIQGNKRTSGLYVYDVAIDLRTLFCISTNQLEPELSISLVENLKNDGWIESKNVFGPCLIMPFEKRKEIIPALAGSILNWRIHTNQSRTFSLMETLAVSISDNANVIAGSIRAKLSEDTEKQRAIPIIDDAAGSKLFIALPCDGYVQGVHGTANALNEAKKKIIEMLNSYDYEKQVFIQ
ncbi:MAG: CRISPR-associated protein Cas7 [Candidatus Kapabacteria bacterium]|nr:CRISPR-associated protein Cas7 [Candidatus Kapabacteria bacterium]